MTTTQKPIGISIRQLAEREERAFPTYPQVARYFPGASIEDARERLTRAIERGDGPGLIIGGPGTGKSLLLQVLAARYHERFDVVLPACARLCTRRALLQAILFELGLPYRVRDEGDLRLSLLDHLLSREECPAGLLLLVDEAQTLSANLLDELRVLTNLVRAGSPRVRLVLAGSSALEESFAHPDLESFSQRLATRCYLSPFGRDETIQFVRAQVAACGAAPDQIFASDAWDAIFEATDGVPRLVNQLCDRALVTATAGHRNQIGRQVIQAAWSEIQQLPAPWETPPPTTAPPAPLQVVEFGSLEEPIERCAEGNPKLLKPTDFRDSDDQESLVAEPTELDEPEVFEESVTTSNGCTSVAFDAYAMGQASTDPFEEEFEEEEVVLDAFASWDNMFRRDTPRVLNRREPQLASLVQSAISTTASCEQFIATPPMSNDPVFVAISGDHCPCGPPASRTSERANSELSALKERPSLRLAIASEPVRQIMDHNDEPTGSPDAWFDTSEQRWTETAASMVADTEDPVLVVEDDDSMSKPPVRREAYRNLFSRLRGD